MSTHLIESIARVCHEANRGYCQTLGDLSQPPWDEAPQWLRDSALAGVTFALANPEATPQQMHESWLMEKLRDGWRFGPTKDAEKKTHPCAVSYYALPPAQQMKDRIFKVIVETMSATKEL